MGFEFDPKKYIRTVPDWPEKGVQFRDITPLLEHPLGFRQTMDHMVYPFMEEGIDLVVGIDARGFIFGAAMAYQLGCGFVPVRKKGKLPYDSISVSYKLEYGTAEVEMHVDAIKPGQKVLIVDDLIATGGTMLAAYELIKQMDANVVAACAVIDLPDLGGADKLREAGLEVFALCEYSGH